MMTWPKIIQGGMGVAISNWTLAQAVSKRGGLGVVSGTGIALVLVGRLMEGDPGGHVRRALAAFPVPAVAQKIIDTYFVEGGKQEHEPYKRTTLWSVKPTQDLNALTVVANFVEVWLAKAGQDNPVGINLLEKVQLPNLASLYGAMLAGVDYVIMGAGIPMQIPGVLLAFTEHQPFDYRLDVHGAGEGDVSLHFDPEQVFPGIAEQVGPLKRPLFLPIVSSVVLALALTKRANGPVDGFVIEMPSAGGHNAPPRGDWQTNDDGEPIYGEKDAVNLAKFRKLGLPFWLAGGYGSAAGLQQALAEGAQGIQVGTAFAYADESGMEPTLRQYVLDQLMAGEDMRVLTSSVASPTGFPFKVVNVPGSVADPEVYAARPRICDVGFLREIYRDENGKVGYRCASEPVDAYVKKGGKPENTEGRVCLCNQLGAAAGFPQVQRTGTLEPPVVTSGDALAELVQFVPAGQNHYSAADVLETLQEGLAL